MSSSNRSSESSGSVSSDSVSSGSVLSGVSKDDIEDERKLNKKKSGDICVDDSYIADGLKQKIAGGARMFNHDSSTTKLLAMLPGLIMDESKQAIALGLASENLEGREGDIPGNCKVAESRWESNRLIEWYTMVGDEKVRFGLAPNSRTASKLWNEQGFKTCQEDFRNHQLRKRNLKDGSYNLFGTIVQYADTTVTYSSNDFGWTKEGLEYVKKTEVKKRSIGNKPFKYFVFELNDEGTGKRIGKAPFMKYKQAKGELKQTLKRNGFGQVKWKGKCVSEGGVWRNACFIEKVGDDEYANMTDPDCGTFENPSAKYIQMREEGLFDYN